MKNKINIFTTAFTQVALVAINTWQIANDKILGALIVGFLISLVWTFNVRKVAFGDKLDRVIYATGAMVGTGAGLYATQILY